MLNRRSFLQKAAGASLGATGLIMLPSTSAKALLEEGQTIITPDDVRNEGKVITSQEYLDEVVEEAKFGDNLAQIVLNARGPITIYRESGRLENNAELFVVYGDTTAGDRFSQHDKYKLAWASRQNRF